MISPRLVGPSLCELERALPNGLHDALLDAITLRPAERAFDLALRVDVRETGEGSEPRYRACRVRISGVAWIEFEPDHVKAVDEPMRIDSGVPEPERLARLGKPPVEPPCFAAWIRVVATNSTICFAAEHAELEWLDAS